MIRWSGSVELNCDVTVRSLHDYVYQKVANIIEQVPEIKTDESRSIVLLNHPQLALLLDKQEEMTEKRKLVKFTLTGKS